MSSHEGSAFEQIMADPRRIFNTDETSFSLCPKSGKVLGPKGWRNVYDLKRGNEKDTLTVLATFSADGKVVPGMIVYPYQRAPREVVVSVPPPWAIGLSDSGWMKSRHVLRVRHQRSRPVHRQREHSETSGFIP